MKLELAIDVPPAAGEVLLHRCGAVFPQGPICAGVYLLDFWQQPNPQWDYEQQFPAGVERRELLLDPPEVFEPIAATDDSGQHGERCWRYVGQTGRSLPERIAEYARACANPVGDDQLNRIAREIVRWLSFSDLPGVSGEHAAGTDWEHEAALEEYSEAHPRAITVTYIVAVEIGVGGAARALRSLDDPWLRLMTENALLFDHSGRAEPLNRTPSTAGQRLAQQAEIEALLDEVFGPT